MGFLDSYLERAQENEHSPVNHWAELANRAVCLLEEIREAVTEDDPGEISPADIPFVIACNGSGDGTQEYIVNPGTSWRLLSMAAQVTGTPSGYLAFYQDTQDGTGLLKVVSLAQLQDEAFQEGCWIAPQSKLIVVVSGGPANGTVAGRMGVTITRHGPHKNTTHGGTN